MLAQQDFHRRDAGTQSTEDDYPQECCPRNTRKTRKKNRSYFASFRVFRGQRSFLSLRLCVSAVIVFLASCGAKPTDPRTVIPGDALVYLESNDLGRTLKAITDN